MFYITETAYNAVVLKDKVRYQLVCLNLDCVVPKRTVCVQVCFMYPTHTRTQLRLAARVLISEGKPERWPLSNIWRPGNYLCKSHPIKRKTNKGGLVKQAPFYSTLHLETVTERAGEIG